MTDLKAAELLRSGRRKRGSISLLHRHLPGAARLGRLLGRLLNGSRVNIAAAASRCVGHGLARRGRMGALGRRMGELGGRL